MRHFRKKQTFKNQAPNHPAIHENHTNSRFQALDQKDLKQKRHSLRGGRRSAYLVAVAVVVVAAAAVVVAVAGGSLWCCLGFALFLCLVALRLPFAGRVALHLLGFVLLCFCLKFSGKRKRPLFKFYSACVEAWFNLTCCLWESPFPALTAETWQFAKAATACRHTKRSRDRGVKREAQRRRKQRQQKSGSAMKTLIQVLS